MSTKMVPETDVKKLITVARLGGCVDTLEELKTWLEAKIKDVEKEYETRKKELHEHSN